ncbi:MAG TPA: CheB methylesterase domain-containing protein [Terriglobales bacterium]|nr:CheB methylesterase domain-containing protein [Terriglobales bacterium]
MEYQRSNLKVVAIGSSAGGPLALGAVFSKLPSTLNAAIVLSQHMPKGFTTRLSERLAILSKLSVREARPVDVLQQQTALVTPGGYNMRMMGDGRIRLEKALQTPSPSIDIMMESAACAYGPNCVGVLLTGMLTDGVSGMKAIKNAGGVTIAQDESSSFIFGMNKAAIEAGVVDAVAPAPKIALAISDALSSSWALLRNTRVTQSLLQY